MNSKKNKSDEEGENNECMMHIGREYQAQISNYNSEESFNNADKSICLWRPPSNPNLADEVENFLEIARFKYSYSYDQALALLNWYNLDISKSLQEIEIWKPQTDGWTIMDKLYFEQAYKSCGKNFRMIQQMLPEKTISELVYYYYIRKRFKSLKSEMDLRGKLLLKPNYQYEKINIQNHSKILTAYAHYDSKFCGISRNIESNNNFIYESPTLWHNNLPIKKKQSNQLPHISFNIEDFLLFKKILKYSKGISNHAQLNFSVPLNNKVHNVTEEHNINEFFSNKEHPSEIVFKKMESAISKYKYKDHKNIQKISKSSKNLPILLIPADTIENFLSASLTFSLKP